MAFAINMPDGSTEIIDPTSLLWVREALPEEWNGANALRFGEGTLYTREPLDSLVHRFRSAGVPICQFTPPAGPVHLMVSAKKVIEIEPSNAAIFHDNARAVLKFSLKTRIAVRETQEEAKAILSAAMQPAV